MGVKLTLTVEATDRTMAERGLAEAAQQYIAGYPERSENWDPTKLESASLDRREEQKDGRSYHWNLKLKENN